MNTAINNDISTIPKILLVDDEPRILRSLNAALRNFYHIFTAHNGIEAKRIIKQGHDFSVIISDEKMPQMLGHELLTWCKSHRPNMARILMTGYSDMNALEKSINEAEIFKYVDKPWDINDIKATIDKAIIQIKSGVFYNGETNDNINVNCELAVLNMVMDNDKIYKNACRAIKQKPVIINSSNDVMELLRMKKNIGVLFIDDDFSDQETIKLVTNIHEKHPQVVIIIATSATDGKSAIQLLNESQIFRYLVKPLTETRLVPMLKAAISRFEEKIQNHDDVKLLIQDESLDSTIKKYWNKMIRFWD